MKFKGFNEPQTNNQIPSKDFTWPKDIRFAESSGEAYGLEVILEKDPNSEDDEQLKVVIHNPLSIPDLRTSGVDVEYGFTTSVKITPSQLKTSESTKGLKMNQRKCNFEDEINQANSSFVQYNQMNCLFECRIKKAFDKCACSPWDYPGESPICDQFGRKCFINSLKDTDDVKNCHCPNDCSITRYAISVSSTPIIAKNLCKKGKIRKYFGQSRKPGFMQKYSKLVNPKWRRKTPMMYCIERVKKVAIVKFYITSQTVTKITRGQRISFATMLSQIGT